MRCDYPGGAWTALHLFYSEDHLEVLAIPIFRKLVAQRRHGLGIEKHLLRGERSHSSHASMPIQALVQKVLDGVAAVEAGKGRFSDDEPFIIAGINQTSNKLFAQDTKLMSHTAKPRPLLHADGSLTTEIVRTVRPPRNLTPTTTSLARGGEVTTVRVFLNDHAIRVSGDFGFDEDSVRGIDWTSTYSSPPGNVQSISAPLLVMGMTGNWEYLASETIFETAKSNGKSVAFVEGASHVYTTCKECEKTPGQFGDTQKTTYDNVDSWLSKKGRFLKGD